MMNEKTKETEKKQRNHNMRYIIYVLALLVIIATLSFALYSNVFTGKNDIIIDTNDLKFFKLPYEIGFPSKMQQQWQMKKE